MKKYIIKVIITLVGIYILFEFTIGTRLDYYKSKIEEIEYKLSSQGRKDSIQQIKIEMKKAIKKENYLDQEEKDLIVQFLNKIKKELEEGKVE